MGANDDDEDEMIRVERPRNAAKRKYGRGGNRWES